jgi:hypothetical protein
VVAPLLPKLYIIECLYWTKNNGLGSFIESSLLDYLYSIICGPILRTLAGVYLAMEDWLIIANDLLLDGSAFEGVSLSNTADSNILLEHST